MKVYCDQCGSLLGTVNVEHFRFYCCGKTIPPEQPIDYDSIANDNSLSLSEKERQLKIWIRRRTKEVDHLSRVASTEIWKATQALKTVTLSRDSLAVITHKGGPTKLQTSNMPKLKLQAWHFLCCADATKRGIAKPDQSYDACKRYAEEYNIASPN